MDNEFFDMTPKAQATKAKIDKWGYIKLKTVYQIYITLLRNVGLLDTDYGISGHYFLTSFLSGYSSDTSLPNLEMLILPRDKPLDIFSFVFLFGHFHPSWL